MENDRPAVVENRLLKSQIGALEQLLEVHEKSVLEKTDELYAEIAKRKHIEEALRQSRDRYRTIIEEMEEWYFESDFAGNIIFSNNVFANTLGYSQKELIGLNFLSFVKKGESDLIYELFNRVFKTGKPAKNIPCEFIRTDGTATSSEFSAFPRRDKDGKVCGFKGVGHDTTERKRSEEALRTSQLQLLEAMDLAHIVYWEFDPVAQTYVFNDPFYAFYGTTAEQEGGYLVTREDYAKRFIHPDDIPLYYQFVEKNTLRQDIELFADIEHRIIHRNGEVRHIQARTRVIKDDSGRIVKRYGVNQDVTERKRAGEKIQYLATHDSLTGLPNRSMFSQLLNHAIQAARRYQRQFAVLFIDLDRFKIINDTLGHEAGDQLLQEIATRLKQPLRAVDIVGRLGGDEFIILIEEVSDSSQVATVAHKVLTGIMKPITLVGQECRITASIGICMYPKDAEDEQSLMKNADVAMYLAKEEGKNNYQFYSEDIQSKSLERLSIEAQLRFALERDEFSLHYQAKVDFKTNAITGVEALLRWQNRYLGSVTPTQFIPAAEETGLIVSIGKWVMRTACAQNVAWQKQGLPVVCMAVNLSLRQLMDDNLIDDIKTALNDSGMASNLLELEITESMVMYNPARMISVLAEIKSLGARLAIDDFGTGYSYLAQIKHFPVDTLKIDRSFIRNIPQDAGDKAITEAIIAMGKTLGLNVVAEGVETGEQMNFLKDLSCDEMQGFYFSRPIMPEQFADLLRNHVPSPLK
jgi:diguanylate cyclase (GGDEF)-like protein/PAS domain S-box-containing protein